MCSATLALFTFFQMSTGSHSLVFIYLFYFTFFQMSTGSHSLVFICTLFYTLIWAVHVWFLFRFVLFFILHSSNWAICALFCVQCDFLKVLLVLYMFVVIPIFHLYFAFFQMSTGSHCLALCLFVFSVIDCVLLL